ncbi:MAG: hypothetical protein COY53_02685 [Elusimicrobia bacterium CG_4_10_14_0_8_um_filter_37_32]|nr:MAG: hypothetical protein COS17_08220 [Elusimicrobia bacterium CG02_land_8_20_14_3_00_37_13]PIZ13859.1 MAG: hypothetical protein COY53_02685 [Elusimicrobia bacterium CG_4_10_14_0_8_um_filter_37_32]
MDIRYGTDDYHILSVHDADRFILIIAGACGRSTIYAVYDFFERRAGIRYFWDGGTPHKGAPVREFIHKHPRLHCYRFPGYAPELNPDEFIWNSLKRSLSNSVPRDLCHLKQLLHSPIQRLRQSQNLLWSCIYASDLPWR